MRRKIVKIKDQVELEYSTEIDGGGGRAPSASRHITKSGGSQ